MLLPNWNHKALSQYWPEIPFCKEVFFVNSFKHIGIDELTEFIDSTCDQMIASQWRQIPRDYFKVFRQAQAFATSQFLVHESQFVAECGLAPDVVTRSLTFFHAIGELIYAHNHVCVRPQRLSKIMAKFISPEQVRNQLWKRDDDFQVDLLRETDIKVLLPGSNHNSKLEMMCLLGVCFKVIETRGEQKVPLYFFPSLTTFSGMLITYVSCLVLT